MLCISMVYLVIIMMIVLMLYNTRGENLMEIGTSKVETVTD